MAKISDRIRELRKYNKLTQSELAEKIGVVPSAITNYELGDRSPDYETIIKMANIFNCSTDYIMGRTNDKNEILPIATNKYDRVVVKAEKENIPPNVIDDFIDFWKKNNKN